MASFLIYLLVFGVPAAVVYLAYMLRQRHKTRTALQQWRESQQAGLTEPASLHPVIDPLKCLGCATCIKACPEGDILGLVNRKAMLVSPSSCIGHGACREACPTDAITLVFGSATRGVEIPALSSDFETSVPGIFIAGELGGMGLIKNAIAQGQQAAEAISRRVGKSAAHDYDLVVVGAGPAGLSAALTARQKGLRYVVVEQDSIGGTVAHYPRGKIVMTRPAVLPIVGKFQFREASKEALVEFWNNVVDKASLNIETGQPVEAIDRIDDGFSVRTPGKTYNAKAVLLAMGRRGTPRKLDVPGEELSKVVYRLIDPEQYANQHVLVVGGGDSALEAAMAVAEQEGTTVTLSYRSESFSRAKAKNRDRIDQLAQQGRLHVLLQSQIKNIAQRSVLIHTHAGDKTFPNDHVIICAGGVLPTPFLKQAGIHVEEKFGTV